MSDYSSSAIPPLDRVETGTQIVCAPLASETQTITLHASPELEVSLAGHKGLSVAVHNAEPPFAKVKAKHLTMEPEEEFLHIRMGEKLRANQSYVVAINFRGKLGTDRGFYKYHYRLNGTLKHLLLTFFEPTFARRAFPCFDEPDFKATFSVTIVRPEGYTALSTMPVKKQEERSNGFVADTFRTTMPMSTYTLAFAVLNFTAQSNGNAQRKESKVNVKRVMKTWVKTPGYPLLTVTRNYTTGVVSLKQEAYTPTDDSKRDRYGYLPYDVALEFLDLVRPEEDYMPWKSALDGMHDLDFLIRKTKYYRKFQVRSRKDMLSEFVA
ncbi:hypothetical protein V5799_023557 [Amblyomma americanum]|uniref:Aminopeptidase N-like N-terminal domain-containing protein n=1 Tax=Amblyomma americanum TaxID=6943 RepID=A0AAQ4FJ84_AMBAM